MAYTFERQNDATFTLNAYGGDKKNTLKNVWAFGDNSKVINGIIDLLTIAGAQSLYTITDGKRTSDEKVTGTP